MVEWSTGDKCLRRAIIPVDRGGSPVSNWTDVAWSGSTLAASWSLSSNEKRKDFKVHCIFMSWAFRLRVVNVKIDSVKCQLRIASWSWRKVIGIELSGAVATKLH